MTVAVQAHSNAVAAIAAASRYMTALVVVFRFMVTAFVANFEISIFHLFSYRIYVRSSSTART